MLRIISGKYKGKLIPASKTAQYRPTKSIVREAIFSIIASGKYLAYDLLSSNTRILDLFCGSGIIALEAISRGVGGATLVDINRQYLAMIKNFACTIGEIDKMRFLHCDAKRLPQAVFCHNLVFMDPPYFSTDLELVLASLKNKHWLDDQAVIVIELSKKTLPPLALGFSLIEERFYGNTKLVILEYVKA